MDEKKSSRTIRDRINYIFSWLRLPLQMGGSGALENEDNVASPRSEIRNDSTIATKNTTTTIASASASGSSSTTTNNKNNKNRDIQSRFSISMPLSSSDQANSASSHQPNKSVILSGDVSQVGSPQHELELGGFSVFTGDESLEQTGFFSFLDSVISGKHNELFKKMAQSCVGNDGTRHVDAVENVSIGGVESLMGFHCKEKLSYSACEQVQRQRPSGRAGASLESMVDLLGGSVCSGGGGGSSAARSLKDYELMAYLGKGSFAEVTLARHKHTHQLYALKKISKHKVREEGYVQHTFTERQLLASLKHPFLVRLHQAFQCRTHLYLVLDFAAGGDFYYFLEKKPWVRDMRRRLHRVWRGHVKGGSTELVSDVAKEETREGLSSNRLCSLPTHSLNSSFTTCSKPLAPDDSRAPIRLIAFCAIEIALVLQYLHEHGFIYRDLKPENVLMMRDGHVVLTDFGVAKYRGGGNKQKSGVERVSSFTGTTQYMSPEMLLGQPHDSRIDWWSFGCMLFEMATGRRPFGAGNQYAVVQSIVERDVEVRPDDFLPTGLELETRAAQLCNRHREFIVHTIHSITARTSCDNEGMRGWENENDNDSGGKSGGDTGGRLLSSSACGNQSLSTLSSRPAPDAVTFSSGNIPLCDDYCVGIEDLSNGPSHDAVHSGAAAYCGESTTYLHHAMKEMEEACRLLQDLILSLLQRSVEKRLSGAAVLEHPFFSCAYVTSQLYYKPFFFSCPSADGGAGSFCSLDKMSTSFAAVSSNAGGAKDHTPPTVASPVSPSDSLARNELHDQGNIHEERIGATGTSNVHKCLGAEFFLSLPLTQRPDNWRELFLNGMVRPLYLPHLRAADDLRYFPTAVTATGDSIVVQQRALRRQMRLKNSKRHSCKGRERDTHIPAGFSTSVVAAVATAAAYDDADAQEEEEEKKDNNEGPVILPSLPPEMLLFKESEDDGRGKALLSLPHDGPLLEAHLSDRGVNAVALSPLKETREARNSLEVQERKSMGNAMYSRNFDVSETSSVSLTSGQGTSVHSNVSDDKFDVHGPAAAAAAKGLGGATLRELKSKSTRATKVPPRPYRANSYASSINAEGTPHPETPASLPASGVTDHNANSWTPSFGATQASALAHGASHSGTDKMRESSSSFLSLFANDDDDEGLLCTFMGSLEMLPDTLHGVAYDVDDYLPYSLRAKEALLLSHTGIPVRKQSDPTKDDERHQKQFHQHPFFARQAEAVHAASSTNPLVETQQPQLASSPPRAPSLADTNPAPPHRSNASNHFTTVDTRRIFTTSTISLHEPILTHSPKCFNSNAGALGVRQINFCADSRELTPTVDTGDEQTTLQLVDNASMGGTSGMQHYLGFTFDAQSGHAFLSGSATYTSSDKMNFSN